MTRRGGHSGCQLPQSYLQWPRAARHRRARRLGPGPRQPKHPAQPGQGAWSGRVARPGLGRSVLCGTELGPGAGLTGAANCLAGPGEAAASAGRGPNGVLECCERRKMMTKNLKQNRV